MANVFQIIATNENDKHFEPQLINGEWHTSIQADRTLCGIQLDGDDGYAPGNFRQGIVTCAGCLFVIRGVKDIRKWQPSPPQQAGGAISHRNRSRWPSRTTRRRAAG